MEEYIKKWKLSKNFEFLKQPKVFSYSRRHLSDGEVVAHLFFVFFAKIGPQKHVMPADRLSKRWMMMSALRKS